MPAQIGPQKKFILSCGSRLNLEEFPSPYESLAEHAQQIHFSADGVSRGGVSFTQFKLHVRAVGRSSSSHQDARRSSGSNSLHAFGQIRSEQRLRRPVGHQRISAREDSKPCINSRRFGASSKEGSPPR